MKNEKITKKEMINIHNEVVEIIRLKLIGYGYNVTPSQNPSYDFNVDGK